MYEYVDNGNLDQWLHGYEGEVSPLTWDIRRNIILGMAKGYYNCVICKISLSYKFCLYQAVVYVMFFIFMVFGRLAYLHEGLEPKVVHRDVKSSNILLDRQWNPKVSDFGLAKLLCSERSYVTTRVMGTFGLVHPSFFAYMKIITRHITDFGLATNYFAVLSGKVTKILVFSVMLHQNMLALEC